MTTQRTAKVDRLMKDIQQYPRLSHEEERNLWEIMHSDDKTAAEKAREKLINCNIRLVVSLAHQFKKYKLDFEDLVQEGIKGLIVAADKFDPDRCPRFSIVASSWVKQSLRKALLSQTRTIRVPDMASQLAARVAKVRHAYEAEFAELPSDEYVASKLGITTRRLAGATIADISIASMNEAVSEDSDTTFEDMLGETLEDEDDFTSDKEDCIHDLHYFINKLPDRDRFLIVHSYGIDCDIVPVEILAQETGMSCRCIRGALYSIYQHLHECLKDKGYSY